MTPEKLTERLALLTERCAAAGIPLTAQRRAIMEVLAGRTDHPTVEQIYSDVAERIPEVSRTTVYRSLEVLSELALIRRVEHPGSAVRFDANLEQHHHFLCVRCGRLEDLPLGAVEGYEGLRFKGSPSQVAQELAVLVRGTCAACAGEAGAQA